MAAFQAITLDFYGTLAHHGAGRGRGASLMAYLTENGLVSDPWEHEVLYDVFERHRVEYDPECPVAERRRYLERFAGRVFRRLNVPPDAAVQTHAENVWRILGPASLALFPDVLPALRRLKAAGLKLAVVSNWHCGLGHFCTELGLGEVVDEVVASAEVGHAKPDPEIFAEAVRRLGVPARHVLHVGDSPIDDVQGGRAAGVEAILLDRQAPPGRVGPHCRSLEELPDLVGLAACG